MAVHGGSLLDPFQTFLERLSQEIEEEQLDSLKFLLENKIPAGILEKCKTPRKLFTRMKQKGLLGENNLDLLEKILTEAQRSDLADSVKDFKKRRMEVDSGSPAMERVCFFFLAQRQHFNEQDTKDTLINNIIVVLHVDPSECQFEQCQELGHDNWFNVTLRLPNRPEVLDRLCYHAMKKEPWLVQCGVKAVRIGEMSEIFMQSPITRSVPTSISGANLPSAQGVVYHCLHDEQKVDMIVVVDCATSNPAFVGQLKAQLKYMVDGMPRENVHFRLAIISYQNHSYSGRLSNQSSFVDAPANYVLNFTDDKRKMKENIDSLRCFRNNRSRSGLADGLALAVRLSNCDDGGDFKCRADALRICVLLPFEVESAGSLEIFKCTHGHDVMDLCRRLAENSVTLYSVPWRTSRPAAAVYLPHLHHSDLITGFFSGLSLMTGGQLICSESVKLVSEIISYVVEVDKSMECLFGTAHDIIIDAIKNNDGDVDLEELLIRVQEELSKRLCHVNLLVINDGSATGPSSKLAQKFSLDTNIDSACKTFLRERERLQKMRQTLQTAPGTPSDVNMKDAAGPQVQLLENQNVTWEVSERMVRRVVVRRGKYRPRKR